MDRELNERAITTIYYYKIMDLHPDSGKKLIGELMGLAQLSDEELKNELQKARPIG